jgi:hypothetical protein
MVFYKFALEYIQDWTSTTREKKKKKTPAITSGKPVNNKFFARDFLLFFTHNLTYKIQDVLCKLRNN